MNFTSHIRTTTTDNTAWKCRDCGQAGVVVHLKSADADAIGRLCAQQHRLVAPMCSAPRMVAKMPPDVTAAWDRMRTH